MIKKISEDVAIIDGFFQKHQCKSLICDLDGFNIFKQQELRQSPSAGSGTDLDVNLEARNSNRIVYESNELAQNVWDALLSFDIQIIIPRSFEVNNSLRF